MKWTKSICAFSNNERRMLITGAIAEFCSQNDIDVNTFIGISVKPINGYDLACFVQCKQVDVGTYYLNGRFVGKDEVVEAIEKYSCVVEIEPTLVEGFPVEFIHPSVRPTCNQAIECESTKFGV